MTRNKLEAFIFHVFFIIYSLNTLFAQNNGNSQSHKLTQSINNKNEDKGLDTYLNEQVKTIGKTVDEIYSGKTPLKGNMPSNPQDFTFEELQEYLKTIPDDFEGQKYAIGEYNGGQADKARSKDRYAQVYSFDTKSTNFERYKSSPCYDEIGFSPIWDMDVLEQRYCACEKELNLDILMKVLFCLAFVSIIVAVIYFSLRKKRE